MGKENLQSLAKESGLNVDIDKQTRDRRDKNVKIMGIKELRGELPRVRKERNQLEVENQALKLALSKGSPDGTDLQIPVKWFAAIPVGAHEFLARRYGAHWRLEEQEALAYGDALSQVANRYLPDVKEHKELVYLGCVIVGTVGRRLADQAIPQKEKDTKGKQEKGNAKPKQD